MAVLIALLVSLGVAQNLTNCAPANVPAGRAGPGIVCPALVSTAVVGGASRLTVNMTAGACGAAGGLPDGFVVTDYNGSGLISTFGTCAGAVWCCDVQNAKLFWPGSRVHPTFRCHRSGDGHLRPRSLRGAVSAHLGEKESDTWHLDWF